ncbi:IS5/IS1182 family transposase [Microcoleus sp. Pol12B4]|uniref:IS5/IS1182 family transposase n=1 Tax=Microcoleus sp. Pol12B4 TaxID=3055395 RepID=UPI002FD345A4
MASSVIWQWIACGSRSSFIAVLANVSDDQGLIEMVPANINYFNDRHEDLPKLTLLLDHGYHPTVLSVALEQIYPQIMTKIQFEVAPKPTQAQKQQQGQMGFVVILTRWVIERSNAWVERCKRLVKNFEGTLENATAKLNVCFIGLMLKRLPKQRLAIANE